MILEYEFMQNALLASLLISVAAGVIGTLVVINRMVFISGGIAHAAYGGVGLAFFLGWNPAISAFAFSLASALGMGLVRRRAKERADTMIGALWAVGMATGVIFTDLTPGYKADLMSYLFGSILSVPRSDLWLMLALDALLIAVTLFFFKELVAVSFDETFAAVRGVPAAAMELLLLGLTAAAVVMLMQAAGLILMIALLTIPVAMAGWFVRDVRSMMALSSLFGMVFTLSGLALSYAFNLTSGATIILTAGAAYLLGLPLRNHFTKRSG